MATEVDVFGFRDPKDILQCLDAMISVFEADPLNKSVAASTEVLCWVVGDWAYRDLKRRKMTDFMHLGDFQLDLRRNERVFDPFQGLGNAFKHGGQVAHPTTQQSATCMEGVFEEGVFVDEAFERERLVLLDSQGQETSCMDAAQKARTFWREC